MVNEDVSDLAAAQAGDLEAFARIYDRHAPAVLSLCRRGDGAAAEDDLQETFIRAHRRLDQLDDPARLRTWLYRIATNVARERRRGERRRRARETRWSASRSESATPASGDGQGTASERELLERLGDALDRLDERERLALHLHYLETNPPQAAAETLRLSRRGYYAMLARARERLGELMGVLTS